MGLPLQGVDKRESLTDGLADASVPETYYTPPLINVIKFACNGCAEKQVLVTEGCQGCLAHPCVEVCPKDAIKLDQRQRPVGTSTRRSASSAAAAPTCAPTTPSSSRSGPAPRPAA